MTARQTLDMEAKDYLGYIAHFWKNLAQTIPREDFVKFLSSNLGASMFNAPLPKIRDTARLMYKGYVTQQYTRYSAFHIISNMDSKKINEYLSDVIALNKKYGVFYDTVDYDLSPVVMDEAIKKSSLTNYKSIFSELLDDDTLKAKKSLKKPTSISIGGKAPRSKNSQIGEVVKSKAKVKSKTSPKTKSKTSPKTKSKTSPKTKSKTSPKAKPKTSPKTKAKSPKTKAKTKAKISPKAKAKVTKKCVDYKVTELKTMATVLKIRGASKMQKKDLCDALGI